MAAKRARRSVPPTWSRYAAPAAFLLGATVAVLLVRSALHAPPAPAPPATTAAAVAKPKPAATAKPAKRKPKPPTTTAAPTAQTYVVQAGDTFGAIAAREGTTVAELERLNPGVASTSLHVGQEIRVR